MAEDKVYAHTRIAKRVLYFGAATKRPNARCLSRKEFFAFSHIHRWFVVFVCVLVKELMLLCVLLWAVEPIARIICLIWIYECLQHHGYIWNEEADMIFSALRFFFSREINAIANLGLLGWIFICGNERAYEWVNTYQRIHRHSYSCTGQRHRCRCHHLHTEMTSIRPNSFDIGRRCNRRYKNMNMC